MARAADGSLDVGKVSWLNAAQDFKQDFLGQVGQFADIVGRHLGVEWGRAFIQDDLAGATVGREQDPGGAEGEGVAVHGGREGAAVAQELAGPGQEQVTEEAGVVGALG